MDLEIQGGIEWVDCSRKRIEMVGCRRGGRLNMVQAGMKFKTLNRLIDERMAFDMLTCFSNLHCLRN